LAGGVAGCADPAPEGLSVVVVAPNGGEALVAGEPVTVRWQVAVPDGVDGAAVTSDVELVDEAGAATVIASDVGGATGTMVEWSPPGVTAAGAYRVRVTVTVGGGAVDDASDGAFTIS